MTCTTLDSWAKLRDHQAELATTSVRELFERDPARFERLSRRLDLGRGAAPMLLDFAKQRATPETVALLCALAREVGLEAHRDRMFAGERVNSTEGRAVLHVALRNRSRRPVHVEGADVMPDVRAALEHMRRASDAVRSGAHRGYTGKRIERRRQHRHRRLGSRTAHGVEALEPYPSAARRCTSSRTSTAPTSRETLSELDPETTLFLVASKTFTTQETLENARTARAWFLGRPEGDPRRRALLRAVDERQGGQEFGIALENMFVFWDWVGGRYSLWSSASASRSRSRSASIASRRCSRARTSSTSTSARRPSRQNLPLVLGLLGVWNTNFWGAETHAVLPYDQTCTACPPTCSRPTWRATARVSIADGRPVPVRHGAGALRRARHQRAARVLPADPPGHAPRAVRLPWPRQHAQPYGRHHRCLLANVLAQTEALMRGKTEAEARAELEAQGLLGRELDALAKHKVFAGKPPLHVAPLPTARPAHARR
jgi:glucose-6-phosphate isomerase